MLDPVDLIGCGPCAEKKQRKGPERVKRSRKACIDAEGFTHFLAGSVYLDPRKAQFIATSIKMELELRTSPDKNDKDIVIFEG